MSKEEVETTQCGAGLGAAQVQVSADSSATTADASQPLSDTRAARMNVYLVSQEGEKFLVSAKIACMSNLVKTMVSEDVQLRDKEEDGEEDEDEIEEVPLPNVKTSTLIKVIEYLTMYDGSPMGELPKPLMSNSLAEYVGAEYVKYVDDMTQDMLFEIVLAANYMDVTPLLELACAKIATMIKGKTPEEIRKTFNIVNDFTPEEEAAVLEENKWCEEA